MIKLEGLSHAVRGPARTSSALQDVNLIIERGETVALMGPNGSGKSTLCRCLNGLLIPERGSVTVDGLSTSDASSAQEIRRRVGMVFQDPSQQLVTWSVAEEIAFGLENLRTQRGLIDSAVRGALDLWDIGALADAHPLHLSAGQMARVALAAVMAMGPSYLVIDEPTSLLDRRGRLDLLEALSDVRDRGDVGVLWVTQYAEEAGLLDRLIVMYEGNVVIDGKPGPVLSRPSRLAEWGLEPPPASLLACRLRGRGIPLRQDHFLMRPLLSEIEAMGLASPLQSQPDGSGNDAGEPLVTPERRSARDAGEPLLSMAGVSYSYPGLGEVLDGITARVEPGEGLGLVGPSGSGKSTLVLLASGGLKPGRGLVRHRGTDGQGGPIGLATQLPEEQFCAPTVAAEVGLALRGSHMDKTAVRARVEACLAAVGLDMGEIGELSPLSLSEGEKKKVAVASALASGSPVLLLDEPTQGLDGRSVGRIQEAVRAHLESGGGAVIASHSGDFLLCSTDGLLALDARSAPRYSAWEEILSGRGGPHELPEGQLMRAALWVGGRPPGRSLRSFEAAVEFLAESILCALGVSSCGAGEGFSQEADTPESGAASGKSP